MKTPFNTFASLNSTDLITIVEAIDSSSDIYITKITASILTHANNKSFTVQSSNVSPGIVAKHTDFTAAAGVPSVVTWDFGANSAPGQSTRGILAATNGDNINITTESGGPAAYIYVEGYQIHPTPPPGSL